MPHLGPCHLEGHFGLNLPHNGCPAHGLGLCGPFGGAFQTNPSDKGCLAWGFGHGAISHPEPHGTWACAIPRHSGPFPVPIWSALRVTVGVTSSIVPFARHPLHAPSDKASFREGTTRGPQHLSLKTGARVQGTRWAKRKRDILLACLIYGERGVW